MTSFTYFVALLDYGKHYPGKTGPSGYEALPVNPEFTRQNVVDEVRRALKSAELVHVKRIEGNFCEDVTEEILGAVRFDDNVEYIGNVLDQQAAAWDHARDLRKHEVA